MLDGINDIELLPLGLAGTDIAWRISKLFSEATNIRASIAFWTLSPLQLGQWIHPHALDALKNAESYLCVDLQSPTNVDALAALKNEGVPVYLNLRRLPKETAKVSGTLGLLHTKMLLIDKNDGSAELWVGSHNWTAFALRGPNTEVSTVIHLTKESNLYSSALKYLDEIRFKLCRPFSLEKIDYYKELQKHLWMKLDQTQYVTELEGENVNHLSGEVIYIFGTEAEDIEMLSTVGRKVFLSVQDSAVYDRTGDSVRYLYRTTILQTGLLSSSNQVASGIGFTQSRRYAYTPQRKFPYLHRTHIVSGAILNNALYFVTLEIGVLDSTNYDLLDTPRGGARLWVETYDDPLVNDVEFGSYSIEHFNHRILVPHDDERANSSQKPMLLFPPDIILDETRFFEDHNQGQLLPESSLDEKRSLGNYRLVSKKVIKRH
jgi:hypothetical protein